MNEQQMINIINSYKNATSALQKFNDVLEESVKKLQYDLTNLQSSNREDSDET